MQLSHTPAATAAVFDDPNLIGSAGLVPILRLAETAGLAALADDHLSVPSDKGAHAGAKVTALVAGIRWTVLRVCTSTPPRTNTIFGGRLSSAILRSILIWVARTGLR